jgi:hypothetical protein
LLAFFHGGGGGVEGFVEVTGRAEGFHTIL